MILGFLIARKKYTLRKVMFVLMIVAGVFLFIFEDNYTESDDENPFLGNSLIGISLLFDGLTGATEDKMRSIARPAAFNFMFYMSLWSIGYNIIGVVIFGEGPKFIEFMIRHPVIIKYLIPVILAGALGELFIYLMLSNFGPLSVSITTTTRKFFSVFLSVIIFGNILTLQQWCAAAIIFAALFGDILFNQKKIEDQSNKIENLEMENQKNTDNVI